MANTIQPTATTQSSAAKNPEDKLRIRLAAEGYNNGMKYSSLHSDAEFASDDDRRNDPDQRKRNCCRNCEHILPPVFALTALCLIVISGIILLAILLQLRLDHFNRICYTPECVETSGVVLSKMDLKADPCQDFFEYSCAAYVVDPMIPADSLQWSTFALMNQRTMSLLRRLLDSIDDTYKGSTSTAVMKAKKFYAACMNLTTPETQGNAPLLKLIKRLGSWSVTSDSLSGTWTQSGWDLESALSTAHSFGAHPLFSIYVSTDNKDNSENIITMDQGSLSFEDFNSYIGNDSRKYHDAFIKYFVEIGQLLGGGTGIDQMAEEVWQLEKAIAGAFVKPSERADTVKMYNKMTLKEVQDLFSDSVDLSKYFKQYFGTNIPMNEQLIARVPDYFQRLAVIAKTASKRTLANHIVWSMVVPMINYMPAPYHLAKQKLKSAIFGVGIPPVHWELCVTTTTDSLGFATGALYVEKYFKEEERILAENMFSAIVKSFLERLPDKVWMDKDTKERAVEKVHALTHKIGYPDFISSVQQLDSYYSKMNVTDSAFDNFLNSEMFNIDLNKARRGKAPDKSEWDMSPAEINAYFQENSNQIVIPAGILQRPFFHSTFPQSFNFGAMGTIIGHELSHGFDNTGRRFDQSGNMAEWWSNSSAEEFDKRSKCFVDEYNDFTIYNHHLDGMSTLGENIADNGGIKISYQAYKTWLAGNDGEDLLLPGLNMTDDQQFFLGFAQIWCTYYNPQYAIQKLTTDVHSNAKYRVNGVVRNVPEFAKAFNCPPSSPLNPSTRCSLW